MTPKLTLIISPPRCASMWLFNAVRRLYASAGLNVKPEDLPIALDRVVECIDAAAADPDQNAAYVVKTHNLMAARGPRVQAATILRDPRDMALSYRRFMGEGVESTPPVFFVERVIAGYQQIKKMWGDALIETRYDDVVHRPTAVLAALRPALGLPDDATTDADIAAALSPEAVVKIIDNAVRRESAAVNLSGFGIERVMDRETGFQSGHVGDGAIGKWRTELSARDNAVIAAKHGKWLEAQGFPVQ